MRHVFSFSLFSSALAISFAITPAHSGHIIENDALKTLSIKPLPSHNMGRIKEQSLASPRSVFDVFSLKDNKTMTFPSKARALDKDASTTQETLPSLVSRKPQRQLASIHPQTFPHTTEEKPKGAPPRKGILRSPGQQLPTKKTVGFDDKEKITYFFHGEQAPTNSLEKTVLSGRVKHVKNGGTSIAQPSDILQPAKSSHEKLNPFISEAFKGYIKAVHQNNSTEIETARRKINLGAHWGHTGAQYFLATELAGQRKLTEALEWSTKAKKDSKNRLANILHTKLLTKAEKTYNHAKEQHQAFQEFTAYQRLKDPCVPSRVPVAFPWKYKIGKETHSTLNGGLRSLYNQAGIALSDDSMSPEAYEKLTALTSKGTAKWLRSAAHFRLYEFEQRKENQEAAIAHLRSAAKLGLVTAQYHYGKYLMAQNNPARTKIAVKHLTQAVLQGYWPAGEILTKHFGQKASQWEKTLKPYGKLQITTKKVATKKN